VYEKRLILWRLAWAYSQDAWSFLPQLLLNSGDVVKQPYSCTKQDKRGLRLKPQVNKRKS